tara:strand:+ start:2286 stop:3818 length:1533 start_codon:yes stop_codon:yes gene_type:complete
MFFGEKERNLVKQVNDELAERVLGQTIAYYPISIEESNFNDIYGEAQEKVSLPPVRVFAYVEVENEQSNAKYGYEYQTKLTVNFHRRRLVEDQNLYVRVGDFIQYGDFFYEIVRTYNDTRYYFGQVEHKFQISAECVRARDGVFRVMPSVDRPTLTQEEATDASNPAPRAAPYPPLAATYITLTADTKLPNERVLTAGAGISLTDSGPGNALTIAASGQNAVGPTGSLQFQQGGGSFTGSANLTFLSSSGRLGINTDAPSHSLTIIGALSASSDAFFGGDVTIAGTLIGGSPLKISGSINIVNSVGTITTVLGSSSLGTGVLSSSLNLADVISASYIHIASASAGTGASASSYLALDSNNNIILTSSTGTGGGGSANAQGPVGSLQFQTGSGGISGSAAVLYDFSNNHLTIDGGLIHSRAAISTVSYTASAANYILGVTTVPTNILFDATTCVTGQVMVIKDETGNASGANLISLNASGSQTIDGNSSAYIESPYGSVLLYTDGADWFIY